MKVKYYENKNTLTMLYFVVLIILTFFLFFNKYGLLKYIQLKSEITSIEQRINLTEKEIVNYTKDIESLKNDDRKLEEVAREKFHMKKRNEKAFRFRDKKEK